MKRVLFVYKYDIRTDGIELKPYCFRWVLAYRLKESYLAAFWAIATPFYCLAKSMNKVSEGDNVSPAEIIRRCLKPLTLERK
jgi:hypothetical protein